MMRRSAFVAVALLLAVVAVPVRAALDQDSEAALADARDFREFRLFYLGDKFRAQELTYVGSARDNRKRTRFSFIYGDCTPGPDSGCAPPYEVQSYSACSRNLAVQSGPRPARRKSIRGAAVYEYSDGEFFDMLEVYTGRTTVVVFAPTAAKARRVVRSLESPNVELGPEDQLGPPARGAVYGKLRCKD
jgi:hypothetical protein